MLAFRPAKFDCDISTLGISGFAETFAEGSYTAGERGRRLGAQISDHRHRRLLRACASGHAAAALPSRVMKSRRFIFPHRLLTTQKGAET